MRDPARILNRFKLMATGISTWPTIESKKSWLRFATGSVGDWGSGKVWSASLVGRAMIDVEATAVLPQASLGDGELAST